MGETIIAICVDGGLVQYVATNDIDLKNVKVVIVDRDCDSPSPQDPTFVPYFQGGEAYLRSDSIAIDSEYALEAYNLTQERGI